MTYDVIIIGAGLYGLYSAELIGRIRGGGNLASAY